MLRKFYGTVLTKKGAPYSKSGMINLRAGINRHIQSPPYNRTLDIMNDASFLPANKVFTGRMRENKESGLDVSKPRESIDQDDLNILFENYFKPGIERGDTNVLLQKVFFDIIYYTGRRGKEGLRELNKKSFDVKTGSDGKEYVEINFNEKTKKNQGAETSAAKRALHDDHHIISELPGKVLCPVKSFKKYLSLLNHKENAFFQYPNKDKTGFKNSPVGKNTLAEMMKEISKAAKLSRIYTNHCVRKSTATAMKRQGFDLNQISHVTKHKNLDSLKHYIGGPTYSDKKKYNEAMFNYSKAEESPPPPKIPAVVTPIVPPSKPIVLQVAQAAPEDPNIQNVPPDQCLVPMYPEEDSNPPKIEEKVAVQTQQNVVNQLRTAQHLFQSAHFNNCNFTFEMPK